MFIERDMNEWRICFISSMLYWCSNALPTTSVAILDKTLRRAMSLSDKKISSANASVLFLVCDSIANIVYPNRVLSN
jgi:hypothetical protein